MKTRLLGFVVMLMLSFALVACGDSAADKMLADVEKFVLTFEDLARKESVSAEDYQKAAKEFQDFDAKFTGANAPKFDGDQVKRFQELYKRLAAAYQELSAKIK
jgi:hypothetical protein